MRYRYLFAAASLSVALASPRSGSLSAVPAQSQTRPAAAVQTAPPSSAAAAPHKALIDQYCVSCHNDRTRTADLALDTMDIADVSKDAALWEKAVRKLRGGLMPPPGMRQPEKPAADALIAYLETSLDQAAAKNPNPGSVALHRLNRAEYAASIKELFAIDVDAAALLPVDDVSEGFDNIASVLKVSPSFLDQYVTAARTVTVQAVGTPMAMDRPARVTLRGGNVDQPYVAGGLPLGTQAAMLADYLFPADGEYEIRATGGGVLLVDGVRVPASGRIALKSGIHKVGVAAAPRSFIESEATLYSFTPGGGGGGGRGGGGGASVQITGPYSPMGEILDTPSRRKVFVCQPANAADEAPCAQKILSNIAKRAFRRPITDKDLEGPLAFFKEGRTTFGTFEAGVQSGLMAIISSPKFLYRAEPAPADAAAGSIQKVTDLELASRLSFFMWSQIPDEELVDLAVKGRLSNPTVLEQQVRRMLADGRSKSLVNNFAFQWLRVRELPDADAILFPNFDQNLKQAFRRELEMFVDAIIREDRTAVDFLTADYTFVNERLAAHYGIPDIRGPQFRRITLQDSNRWGLLGKGGVLLATSYPNRTSPVIRGAWILENIMGTPPAAPPPDVEGFRENKEGEKALTIREIMEQHRAKPSCNACHGVMDPLGFAFENFDAVGEWRAKDRYAQTRIDASGKLVDGTPVNSPDDIRKALLRKPEQFVETLTERLMTYGLGRGLEYYDMPTVRKIVRDSARDNYRFSSIVLGIVKSPPFLTKKIPVADASTVAAK